MAVPFVPRDALYLALRYCEHFSRLEDLLRIELEFAALAACAAIKALLILVLFTAAPLFVKLTLVFLL